MPFATFPGAPPVRTKPQPKRATVPTRRGAVGRGADTTAPRRTSTKRAVVAPDRADERAALRKRQIGASRSVSPDRQDEKRSASQQADDRAVVAQNVRVSRSNVVARRQGRSLRSGISHALSAPIRLQQGDTRAVSPAQARKARAQGKTVRTLTAEESKDVGATIGVKSIGGGTTALTRMPLAVALGIKRDPGTAIPATLKGLRDMVTGAPAGVVKAITDPKGTLKDTAKDYGRRYRDINKPGGVSKTADRIAKEGAAPELADLTAVGVPAGKALDLALGAAARGGKLGARLAEATTAARPALRTTGGDAAAQTRSRTLSGALREGRKDRQAGAAIARDVHGADEAAAAHAVREIEGLPDARSAAAHERVPRTDPRRTKGDVDAVVREAFNRGEVVPTRLARPGRRVVSQRQLARAQERSYAREKGRALHRQRAEQREEIHKGANKTLAGLNRHEKVAFKTAMQSGATTPAAGLAAVKRRIAIIENTRRYGDDTLNSDVDELPALRRIEANPRAHFTPRLERAVRLEMERGARVGEGDPALGRTATERAETAEARRLAPQADLQAVRRGGTPVGEAIKSGDQQVRAARQRKNVAKRAHEKAELRAAAARGYAQSGANRAKHAMGERRRTLADGTVVPGRGPIGRAERAAEAHENAAHNWEQKSSRARTAHTKADYEARAAAAYDRAKNARENLERLEGGKAAARPEYRRAVQKTRARAADARRELDTRNQEVRAAGEAARSLRRQKRNGAELINAEPMRDYHARVRAARPEGVGEPGFFPSVRREQTRFSPFTIGGARRTKPDARYRGKLFRAGREDGSVTTYTGALAKNIKRKHNWGLVADTIEAHAFSWGKGIKYADARDLLAKKGISEDSVRIIDMDAFDARAARAAAEGDSTHDPARAAETDLHEAFSKSMLDTQAIDRAADLEPGAGRLLIVPKHVGEEIMSDTKPSGFLGRGLDIAKGKQARIMLGLSPAWLQFQVAANVIQTAMATKSLPGEWIYANTKWWHSLSDGEQKALEPYVGIGSFHDAIEKPHMGAAAQGGLINAYRAFKAHDFWHAPRGKLRGASVSQLNPLDTLFRLDNAQNNFFRRAVLYNRLKREAFDRMGESMKVHQRVVDKTIGVTGSDPQRMIRSLVHDRAALEKGAEAVNDFLGDYMTYTSKERRTLSRNIMFYGYLRFSLKFTFYTMPVKHPVMTSIIGQLGGINAREVRELLGGDELPWALGKLYWTKDNKLKEIDLSRANPFMNAITQAKIPEKGVVRGLLQSAVGFLPPMLGTAANIAFAKSLYKDRAYKVNGESSARPNKDGAAITDGDALQIFTKEMLGLTALYRLEEKARADGRPVSDDSILYVNEKYTKYKDPALRASVRRASEDTSPGKLRMQSLFPLAPRTSKDPETAAKIRRATGKTATSGSAPATANAPGLDPETQKLIDTYANQGPSSADIDELSKLIATYGG